MSKTKTFYIDANGTDGSNSNKVQRVYGDGHRVSMSEAESPSADWSNFLIELLNNNGYKRVRSLVDLKLVIDLQDVIGQQQPVESIQKCWDALIDSVLLNVLNKPTSTEISSWNKIAKDNALPITFNSTGKIILG